MPRTLPFVLAGLLVLAGCTTKLGGAAGPTEDRSDPLTSASFGDLSTIDPCSLTGPAAFEEYGTATTPGKPSMDECTISVATDNGRVAVRIGELHHPETLSERQRVVRKLSRGASIVHVGSASGTVCVMTLLLADDIALMSTAQPTEQETVSDTVLCGIAQGGAQGAFQVADSGRVKHWAPETGSLATVSACDLLSADKVASLLGITSDRVTRFPADHQCRWGRTGGDTATALLDFPVATDHEEAGVPTGLAAETIGGRPSWVVDTPTSQLAICAVYTEHLEFGLGVGVGVREHAVLRVLVPLTVGKDACAIARELADGAWQRLPDAT